MEKPSELPKYFMVSDGTSCCCVEAHCCDLKCFLFPDYGTCQLGRWPFYCRSNICQQWESFYVLSPLWPELLLMFWLLLVVEYWT